MEMSGEEKRKQLKEQYLQDLRERKAILSRVEKLRKTEGARKALSEINQMMQEDDSDEWIAKLNDETALAEAKTAMAFEEGAALDREIKQLAYETQQQKASALDMVEQMKRELGLLPKEADSQEDTESQAETPQQTEETEPKSEDELFSGGNKTLGDF